MLNKYSKYLSQFSNHIFLIEHKISIIKNAALNFKQFKSLPYHEPKIESNAGASALDFSASKVKKAFHGNLRR
jgi:hypothetical protein